MPVTAHTWIRRMRGGSQAHLIRASNGHFYVLKTKQNPQHRRVLVNEWVAAILLRRLGIPTPDTELIDLTPEFLQQYPDVCIRLGSQVTPVEPGFHFGSRVPVDPDRFVIYDYLPDALLAHVANPGDFLGALVFDKWTSNTDSRQCVFYRARIRGAGAETRGGSALAALMLDNGFAFGGPGWSLDNSPHMGLYHATRVYEPVTSLESFQPWLDGVRNLPASHLDEAYRQIPAWWLNGDRAQFEQMLEKLWRKRARVPHLIEDVKLARPQDFPNWK